MIAAHGPGESGNLDCKTLNSYRSNYSFVYNFVKYMQEVVVFRGFYSYSLLCQEILEILGNGHANGV